MSALYRLTSWWITDDPDDVARERCGRDAAVERLDRVAAVLIRLRARIDEITRRCEELEHQADHYRHGWQSGGPFTDYRADTGGTPGRVGLPRAS